MTLGTVFNDPTMSWSGRVRSLFYWSTLIAGVNVVLLFKASWRAKFVYSPTVLIVLVCVMIFVSPLLVSRYTAGAFGLRLGVLGYAVSKHTLVLLAYSCVLQQRIIVPTGKIALERLIAFADKQIGISPEWTSHMDEMSRLILTTVWGIILVTGKFLLLIGAMIVIPLLLLIVVQAVQELVDLLFAHVFLNQGSETNRK